MTDATQTLLVVLGVTGLAMVATLLIPSLSVPTHSFSARSDLEMDAHHLLRSAKKDSAKSRKRRGSRAITIENLPAVAAAALSVSTSEKILSNDDVDYQSIIEKWQMPKEAISLLRDVRSRPVGFDYNRETDILALRHPLKTGGTSFSMMMKEIFGDGVMPGSGKSQWFKRQDFEKALQEHPPEIDPNYWRNITAFYTHSFLRETDENKNLLNELRARVPVLEEKKFRLMTIVRRPLDLAASSFWETKCRIGTYSGSRGIRDAEICPTVNLTAISEQMRQEKQECLAGTREKRCGFLLKKKEHFFEVCGSLDTMLERGGAHNQLYQSLMGFLPEPPEFERSMTPTLKDVAIYSIQDLGGLMDVHKKYKEDIIMFLITERMKESLCLFHYHFKIEPVKERHALYKHCRPLRIWEERHKRIVEEREQFDYTVWRAANSVMDVRMAAMRLEIKGRIDAGESLDEIPFLGQGCYDDTTISST